MSSTGSQAKQDLFEWVADNAANLKQSYERRLEESASPKVLEEFANHVATHGRVSLNRRLAGGARFVNDNCYRNIYEAAAEEARLSPGKDAADIVREKLGIYYERRRCFDDHFVQREQLHYGALNIGGAGCTHYGVLCFVLNEAFPADRNAVAYVWGDSLLNYVDTQCNFDKEAFRADLAGHDGRHMLAAVKHAPEVEKTGVVITVWNKIVCSSRQYVEVIFTASVGLAEVAEVRISRSEYNRLVAMAINIALGNASAAERAEAQDFAVLREAANAGRIKIVKVADGA